jgi:hypothetical protein
MLLPPVFSPGRETGRRRSRYPEVVYNRFLCYHLKINSRVDVYPDKREGFMGRNPQLTLKSLAPAILVILMLLPSASGYGEIMLSKGQTVYVPVYSHVYTGDRALPVNLATTLSIRNTDPVRAITIAGADYYHNDGKLVKRMLSKPVSLAPMASTSIYIREKDTSGGYSPSFLVKWFSNGEVTAPVIECLMIGAYSGLGISFVSPGQQVR